MVVAISQDNLFLYLYRFEWLSLTTIKGMNQLGKPSDWPEYVNGDLMQQDGLKT